MTTETAPTPVAARRGVLLSPRLRQHRCDVARFALATGSPLNLDAITVILAIRDGEATSSKVPFTRWTDRRVTELLWGNVLEWCAINGVAEPHNVAETLWTYLTFLFEEGELASGSSRLAALRLALVENAGITRTGRARHPAGRRRGAEVLPIRA
jgi:hypothetical protein